MTARRPKRFRRAMTTFGLFLPAVFAASYLQKVEYAREAVLRQDQQILKSAIQSYTKDKGKPPLSVEDLVRFAYLKAAPSERF